MRPNQRPVSCAHCGVAFSVKASYVNKARFCSLYCKAESERRHPPNTHRPCVVCGTVFKPTRKRGSARFCSKRCQFTITKPLDHNARVSRSTAQKRGDKQRGRGEQKTYTKRAGRHEHRLVAERALGRGLRPGEIVHHIDGDKRNNEPGNLQVMTQAEHMREHGLGIPGVRPASEPWRFRWPAKGEKQ